MSDGKFDANSRAQTAETTLDLLEAVAEDGAVSQRNLAQRLGIALGLTNAVLKRCVNKGLLKLQQVPAKRYAYYLTPKGFAEKSRLTAEYLSFSLQFYRTAREEYTDLFRYCQTRGWKRVALAGASDLAEIATLAASGADLEIVGVVDPGRNESAFIGLPVYQSLEDIDPSQRPSAVIVTDLINPQDAYDCLTVALPSDRVLAPRLMRITMPADQATGNESEDGDGA